MNLIFHVAKTSEWLEAKTTRHYFPKKSQEEFIHCAYISQVLSVLETYFSDSTEPLTLLCINEGRVKESIICEGLTPVVYPHIYGPLNLSAVIESLDLGQSPQKQWQLPLRAKQMAKYIEVKTPRLQLREMTPNDFDDVHAYASQSQVVQYQLWGPNSEMDTWDFLNEAIQGQRDHPRQDFYLGIILKKTGSLIGACNLTIESERHRVAEFGYVIHPDHWGKGYATEAVQALMHLGFSHLQLHRMSATCDEKNIGSARVLEKVGCQKEGLLRENFWLRGRWRNSLIFGMLKKEWRKISLSQTKG